MLLAARGVSPRSPEAGPRLGDELQRRRGQSLTTVSPVFSFRVKQVELRGGVHSFLCILSFQHDTLKTEGDSL